MSKKVKEPFLGARTINFLIGIVILALVVLILAKREGTEIYQTILFGLAAVENFIGAIISLSEQKKVRGHIYAIVCALFLVVALILAVRYFVFV